MISTTAVLCGASSTAASQRFSLAHGFRIIPTYPTAPTLGGGFGLPAFCPCWSPFWFQNSLWRKRLRNAGKFGNTNLHFRVRVEMHVICHVLNPFFVCLAKAGPEPTHILPLWAVSSIPIPDTPITR